MNEKQIAQSIKYLSTDEAIEILTPRFCRVLTDYENYASETESVDEAYTKLVCAEKTALAALREKQERENSETIMPCDEMRAGIFNLIIAERARQDHKWGAPQENTFSEWAGILAEECGEASAELNELNFGRGSKEKAVKELIEVAAVAVAAIEQYDVAEMVTAAWYAYRRNRQQENAEPLTLDELRDMKGEPVYVTCMDGSNGAWGIVNIFDDAVCVVAANLMTYPFCDHKDDPIAYRTKPKGGTGLER